MAGRSLHRRLQRLLGAHRLARQGGPPADELLAQWSRRAVLRAGSAGLLVGCGTRFRFGQGFRANPGGARVVIIGGGLAGLTACHRLAKLGFYAEIYEASDTPGGRVRTGRALFSSDPDQYAELGGEFIDSWHDELLALAEELDLSLFDRAEEQALEVCYQVGGTRYSDADLVGQLGPIADAVDAAWDSLEEGGETVSYEHDGGCGVWDRVSVAEFMAGIECEDAIRAVVSVAYLGEYGLELDEQSSLNLILMLGTESETLDLYGGSDERYKVSGGNDMVVSTLAARYADQIFPGCSLSALRENEDGSFTLSFEQGEDVDADVVVLALPFAVLRDLDLDVSLPAVKRKAIDELGYGTNAKILQPYSVRFWRDGGDDGQSYSDLPSQCTWDGSLSHPDGLGVLTNYLGGDRAVAVADGTADEAASQLILDIDKLYPGSAAAALQGAARICWHAEPFAKGSYPSYKLGQYTGISGAEAEPVGRLIFVGDHTSWDWQGYMNGAVQSGYRGAREVADLLEGKARVRNLPRACRRRPSRARYRRVKADLSWG